MQTGKEKFEEEKKRRQEEKIRDEQKFTVQSSVRLRRIEP